MATDNFGEKLKSLGYELPTWSLPPTEHLVIAYEQRFSLELPADYRQFLIQYGGVVGTATCPFQEPTPHGSECGVESFYGFMPPDRQSHDVRWATELIDGAPAVVAIADCYGGMVWLKCVGKDSGHVYMDDGDQRGCWPDEMFYKSFPALHEEIKHYLKLRRQGELPVKPKGYSNVYRLACSFSEFIMALMPDHE